MLMEEKEEQDFGADFNSSEDEGPADGSHKKLLSAVSQLYNKKRVEAPKRREPTVQVSEFHLSSSHVDSTEKKNQVVVNDLARALNKKPIHKEVTDKIKTLRTKGKTLPKPLEKIHADKATRSVGFKNLREKLTRWDAVIQRNRASDQLRYPLIKVEKVKVDDTDFMSTFSKPTELELQVASILKGSAVIQEEKKAEEELLYPLSIEEMVEKRKMMARIRAQESYRIAKAARQNKIKSKKYHRILRQEKIKEELKTFESLKETDPEAALEKLQQLERARAEERATLRHKNTGQWAKSRAIRAKYDKEARIELSEQLAKSRELTQKLKLDNSSSEEDEDNEEDDGGAKKVTVMNGGENATDNPWVNASDRIEGAEIKEFVSAFKNFCREKKKKEMAETARQEREKLPPMKRPPGMEEDNPDGDGDGHVEISDGKEKEFSLDDIEDISEGDDRPTESAVEDDTEEVNEKREGNGALDADTEDKMCEDNETTLNDKTGETENGQSKVNGEKRGTLKSPLKGNIVLQMDEIKKNQLQKELLTEGENRSITDAGWEATAVMSVNKEKANVNESNEVENEIGKERFSVKGKVAGSSEEEEKIRKECKETIIKSPGKDKRIKEGGNSETEKEKFETKKLTSQTGDCARKGRKPLCSKLGFSVEKKLSNSKEIRCFTPKTNIVEAHGNQFLVSCEKESRKRNLKSTGESSAIAGSNKRKRYSSRNFQEEVTNLSGKWTITPTKVADRQQRETTKRKNRKRKSSKTIEENCEQTIENKSLQAKGESEKSKDMGTIEDIFKNVEYSMKKVARAKIDSLKAEIGKNRKLDGEGERETAEKDDDIALDNLSFRKSRLRSQIDEAMIEMAEGISNATPVDVKKLLAMSEQIGERKADGEATEPDVIDPDKFLNVKPKSLKTQIPDLVTAGDEGVEDDVEDEEDDEARRRMNLAEAFADDDVVDQFRKEKEDEIKESQPAAIDLSLPGWGDWAGTSLPAVSKRKRRRFITKIPQVKRRDRNKGHVILTDRGNEKIRQHMVSDLPQSFTSVKEFEASVRAPIGTTWVPQLAHQKLSALPVITKMGTIIEPMDEHQLADTDKIRSEIEARSKPLMKSERNGK